MTLLVLSSRHIWIDSSARNSCNASVASSDRFIPRFFLGERERHFSSVAIFVTTTRYAKRGLESAWKSPERHRWAFTRTNFFARCLVYRCRDCLREVVSAPLKFWALVPHYVWDRHVYTSKIGSAVPWNRQLGAKSLACRADFLARVNVVLDFDESLSSLLNSCYNQGFQKNCPINQWWTRWFYFRDTNGYHSNTITC